MKQEKDNWVDEVTSSIEGIQRPEANPFLYEKIRYRMQQGRRTAYAHVRSNIVSWAVAAVLLLAVNGFSIINKLSREQKAAQTESAENILPETSLTIYNY